MTEPQEKSLGTRTVHGMIWAFGSYAGGRLLVLLSTAILARLLTPEDFGLVALALAFIGVLEGVSTLGLGQALIVEEDEGLEERTQTAFVWSIVSGLLVSAAIVALSPVIADFFGDPDLRDIAAVLGTTFFVRSLGITHYSLAQRDLDFRARTIAEFADVIARGATGIALAVAGFGAWSLVLGYLVGAVTLDIVIWQRVSWRPSRRWPTEHLRGLLRFGGTLSAVQVVATVGNTIDTMFVGRVLGPTALGLYSIAFMVPNLSIVNIAVIAQRVLFPAMATQEEGALSRSFLVTVRYLWMLTLPVAVLLIALARPAILVAFGDQWLDAVTAMQVLVIYAFALATSFAAGTVYAATSRPGILLYLIAARLVLLVAGLLLFTDLGIAAVAACQAVAVGSVEAVGLVIASRMLKVSLRQIWAEIWPSIAAVVLMAIPVVAIERLISDPWIAVGAGGLAGTVVYVGALMVIRPDAVAYLRAKLAPAPPAPAA